MFRGVVCRLSVLCHASALNKIASRIEMPFGVDTGVFHTSNIHVLRGGPEPTEGPPFPLPPVGGLTYARGFMLVCVRLQMYYDGCCSVR